jgi:hypothetical protein
VTTIGTPETLDDLTHLRAVVRRNLQAVEDEILGSFVADSLYCGRCADYRRMTIVAHHLPLSFHEWMRSPAPPTAADDPVPASILLPSLFLYTCVQCSAEFTATVHQGPGGPALVVLPSVHAGLTTPNTPAAVAYYLDQAQRAHTLGANSAAVAMFRAALEQLLHEQGYSTGMLATKLKALEASIMDGTARAWVKDLDTEFLSLLKDLGNGAIHPNGGDISKQAVLDAALVRQLTAVFQYLLFTVYEVPLRTAALKADWRLRAGMVSKI